MLLKVFAGWFLHCKHTNIVLCGSVSNELACSSSAVTLLPTPQPDRGSDCQVDFWWATVEAATFTPGLMRLRAVWGVLGNSAVFGGVRTTAAGVGEGGPDGASYLQEVALVCPRTLALPPASAPPHPFQLMNRQMECLPPLSRATVMHWGRVSISCDQTGRILAKWSSLYYLGIIRLIYGWILSAPGKFHKASQGVQVLQLV